MKEKKEKNHKVIIGAKKIIVHLKNLVPNYTVPSVSKKIQARINKSTT